MNWNHQTMNGRACCGLLATLLLFSCASVGVGVSPSATNGASKSRAGVPTPVMNLDEGHRDTMLGAMRDLEGRWTDPDGGELLIEVSSGGSVVRELLNPGQDFEMTNMYSLDGNDLRMVHYCAIGNQPHMRASSMDGRKIAFKPDGVTDLKTSDQVYMGAMTLHLLDADHIEQHWTSFTNGQPGEPMVMAFERAD